MRVLAGVVLALVTGAGGPPVESRSDLNGSRVRAPGQATVYLIDRGYRRAVPNIAAYEALFRDWECVVEDVDVDSIRLGDPLSEPCLVKLAGQAVVYFVDGVTRRQVASTQVMDKYRFAWERVREVTPEEMSRWPEGPKLR